VVKLTSYELLVFTCFPHTSLYTLSLDHDDFVGVGYSLLVFNSLHRSACFHIAVEDDSTVESTEWFKVELSIPYLSDHVMFEPQEAEVFILDDDGIFI